MKKLLAITISGLIGLSAAAQVDRQSETQPDSLAGALSAPVKLTTDASKIYDTGRPTGLTGRPVITTDASVVYGAGRGSGKARAQFQLGKGHYIIGEDQSDGHEPFSLFVNPSANNPDNYVALYIESNVFSAEVGSAQIMMGRPTKSGAEIQFAPAKINSITGHLEDTSFESTTARALRISKKADAGERGVEYGYIVRRLNVVDRLPTILGMRAAKSNLDLRFGATRNSFELENKRNKVLVVGEQLIESRPGSAQEMFEMFNYNNDFGAFYALTKTTENTRTTDSGSDTVVEKFVVFMSEAHVRTSSPNDVLLMLTPSSGDTFRAELYAPAQQLNWFQKIFGSKGRLTPANTKWQNPFSNTFHSDATVN